MNNLLIKFLEFFSNIWEQTLAELPFEQVQLKIGNRIRPQLVFWGYCFGLDDLIVSDEQLTELAKMSVSIELIHKSSVILDDWIDGDVCRHGSASCHVELGVPESVLFALNMLSKSLIMAKNTFSEKKFFLDSINYLLDIIYKMSLGAIKELQLDKNTVQLKSQIKEIIDLETSTLISNSLLIGYRMNTNCKTIAFNIIKSIGDNCGYIFQIMNDLEPFCNIEKSKKYKGTINFDFTNGKKNIIYPIIIDILSERDLQKLRETKDEKTILHLFKKYKIDKFLLEEINQIYAQINNDILLLIKSGCSTNTLVEFKTFCNSLHKKFSNRLI